MNKSLIKSIKKKLRPHLVNFKGPKFNERIIAIESDDWGSIRMPSINTYFQLKEKGHKLSHNDSLDCLENKGDFNSFISVLAHHTNGEGYFPKATLNVVMGNPDFEKMKSNYFWTFEHQHFFDSYKFYHGQDLKSLWYQGIREGFVKPQFHAREHLHVPCWLADLKDGNTATREGFDHHFFGIKTKEGKCTQKDYLAAYHIEDENSISRIQSIAEEGLDMFEKTFGFQSKSFVACNYVWPKAIESTLKKRGVNYIQTRKEQIAPFIKDGNLKNNIYKHYNGEVNKHGQIYLVRNVPFEPHLNQNFDWVSQALKDIGWAFKWRKPAIISTHRSNYVSTMSQSNKDLSLQKLNRLLEKIVKKWPDVQFLTSDELGDKLFK